MRKKLTMKKNLKKKLTMNEEKIDEKFDDE